MWLPAPSSHVHFIFFSRLSCIIYCSLLCKRFTSSTIPSDSHGSNWLQWLERMSSKHSSTCRGTAFQGKETFLLLGQWPRGAGRCPQHHPGPGELLSSLCSCTSTGSLPLHLCQCPPSMGLEMCKASIQLWCTLCSLVEQPDQPRRHQVSFHFPGQILFFSCLCVFLPQQPPLTSFQCHTHNLRELDIYSP